MQGGNWSYMQASQELDRIIKSSATSASTPCTIHSYANTVTPDVSCSICGHSSAHFPIRSSSEVLSSSFNTPRTSSRAHSTSYNSDHIHTQSRIFSGSSLKTSTPNVSHTISAESSQGTNASRHLRHRLAPHPVAYPTSPLAHSSRSSAKAHTPENLIHTEAQSAANSVVSAFRELQTKTKMIESERISAFAVRDELRQELAEIRRKHGLSRDKDETRNYKHLQSIRASTDEQLVSYNRSRNIYQQERDVDQTQRNEVEKLTTAQHQLTGDIESLNSKILAAEQRLRRLREDLLSSRDQSNSLEKVLGSQSMREKADVQKEIDTLTAAIREEQSAATHSSVRIEGLAKYLEIILKVNGDLVNAVTSRQTLDEKIATVARQQMKKLLKNREKEVNKILTNARDLGVQKALLMSRNVNLLGDMYLSQAAHSRDSSLVNAAARMAATSAANAVVANNLAATSSSSCSACYRPKFIPSSANKNQEFNVVASVSKAAREAKSLNAKLASKVKSLDCEGIGALYKDVYRVDLQDMHAQLRAVKKVLQTSS